MNNKTIVLITGAGSGIGKELTDIYLSKNFFVIALDKDLSGLDTKNKNMLSVQCDLSTPTRRDVFKNLCKQYNVDIIIANAGIGGVNPGYHFSTDLNSMFFEVNYFSIVDLIMTFIPQMKERKSGHISVISSLASFRGMPQAASYSSSKSAINKTIESFRIDLAPYNIRFSNIMPGFIKTKMTDHSEFSMPFMVSPEKAASLIYKAIKKNKKNYYFPKMMALLSFLNRFLPVGLFTFIMSNFVSDQNKKPKSF
tara:strand:- start:2316 stop:3074 length:759 start_codon:yes stop_codon:yes gene_type:complete